MDDYTDLTLIRLFFDQTEQEEPSEAEAMGEVSPNGLEALELADVLGISDELMQSLGMEMLEQSMQENKDYRKFLR